MATLYRTSRVYAGVCTLITIIKRDGRKASKNCDMIVRVYIPANQVNGVVVLVYVGSP